MKGWKTVLFNVAAAILPILEVSGMDLGLSGTGLAIYAIAINAMNIFLRTVTTTPVGQKN